MNRLVVTLVAALLAAPAVAEQPGPQRHAPTLGVGIGFEPYNAFVGTSNSHVPVVLYVPIQVAERLRIEPQVGVWHQSFNSAYATAGTNSGLYAETAWSVGAGALFYLTPPSTSAYVGARAMAVFVTRSFVLASGGTVDGSETDWTVAPVIGGEQAFGDRFTLGAELGFPVTWYGNPSWSNGAAQQSIDQTGFRTSASVYLRYFFW